MLVPVTRTEVQKVQDTKAAVTGGMDVLLFIFLMSYSPPGWLILRVNLTCGKAGC